MPDDDFKLSLDVEADLSKLDNTLFTAENKVNMAAQKMQRSLSSVGIGGGNSYSSSPVLAGQSQAANLPGTGVSFGGAFRAGAGNATHASRELSAAQVLGGSSPIVPNNYNMPQGVGSTIAAQQESYVTGTNAVFGGGIRAVSGNAFLPHNQNGLAAKALLLNQIRRFGGNPEPTPGFLAPGSFTRFGAAVAGLGFEAYEGATALTSVVSAYGHALKAKAFGPGNYAEQEREMAGAEADIRNIPLFGKLYGARLDWMRSVAYASGDYRNSSSPAQRAQAGLEIREKQYANAKGPFGGGYYGELQELSQHYADLSREETDRLGKESDVQHSARMAADKATIRRQVDEINFKRSQDLLQIGSATKQANLRAVGLSGLADVESIRQSHREEIALAQVQGDKKREDALTSLQSSEIFESLMGNTQPAQEFTPGTMALGPGSIRTGGIGNNARDVGRLLEDINRNVSAAMPVVGRN